MSSDFPESPERFSRLMAELGAKRHEAMGLKGVSPLDVPYEMLATPSMGRTKVEAWLASIGHDIEGVAEEVDYGGEYRL